MRANGLQKIATKIAIFHATETYADGENGIRQLSQSDEGGDMKQTYKITRWTDNSVIATGKAESMLELAEKLVGNGANLVGANLVDANLVGAKLAGANLDDANLDDANLVSARLDHARLDHARLVGASLDGAKLDGARPDEGRLGSASI